MGTKNEEYLEQLGDKTAAASVPTTFQPSSTSTTVADDDGIDYYEELKNQNYKTLLDKEIQLDVARQRAQNRMGTQLNAQGFGSSGYGQTAQTGINSAYLSALGQAEQAYNTENNNIALQQQEAQEAEANDNFQSLTTLMQSATTSDQLNKILSNYDISYDGENFSGEGWDSLDAESQKQLQSLYDLYVDNLSSNADSVYTYNNQSVTKYYDSEGNEQSINLDGGYENGWNKENKGLQEAIANGSIPSGSYIDLCNKHGNHIYVYYSNGQLYYATPEQYNNAQSKYQFNSGYEYTKQ